MADDYFWDIRTPGGMLGIEVAKAVMAATDRVLAHAMPDTIEVTVRDGEGRVVARADQLGADGSTPMARLSLVDGVVERHQVWPDDTDLGCPVVLPGGEVGVLTRWWNAPDGSEWRWQVEFHNKT